MLCRASVICLYVALLCVCCVLFVICCAFVYMKILLLLLSELPESQEEQQPQSGEQTTHKRWTFLSCHYTGYQECSKQGSSPLELRQGWIRRRRNIWKTEGMMMNVLSLVWANKKTPRVHYICSFNTLCVKIFCCRSLWVLNERPYLMNKTHETIHRKLEAERKMYGRVRVFILVRTLMICMLV